MKFDPPWAKLVRLPNTPTVIADVLAGFTLAAGAWTPALPLVLIIASIVALYWSGMVFNDFADIEQDRIERPKRPLPSGAISLAVAKYFGIVLLVLGVVFALGTDLTLRSYNVDHKLTFGITITAVVLGVFILLYDVVAKKTWAGPWFMGACRTCSLLLGCAAGGFFLSGAEVFVPRAAIVIAVIGHGVYVAGFTLAGRKEAAISARSDLLNGWIICIAGIFVLGCVDYSATYFGIDSSHRRFLNPYVYPALIGVLTLPLLRHVLRTLQTKAGREIQGAIKQAIITIIFFDAAIAVQFGSEIQAVVICAMIVPMMLLGRWMYST